MFKLCLELNVTSIGLAVCSLESRLDARLNAQNRKDRAEIFHLPGDRHSRRKAIFGSQGVSRIIDQLWKDNPTVSCKLKNPCDQTIKTTIMEWHWSSY